MYRCNRCKSTGITPARMYEQDCVSADVCRSCGSDDLRISSVNCSVCGEPLYEGDSAFSVKELIVCPNCATEIIL